MTPTARHQSVVETYGAQRKGAERHVENEHHRQAMSRKLQHFKNQDEQMQAFRARLEQQRGVSRTADVEPHQQAWWEKAHGTKQTQTENKTAGQNKERILQQGAAAEDKSSQQAKQHQQSSNKAKETEQPTVVEKYGAPVERASQQQQVPAKGQNKGLAK